MCALAKSNKTQCEKSVLKRKLIPSKDRLGLRHCCDYLKENGLPCTNAFEDNDYLVTLTPSINTKGTRE